ncbi:MAG TPA: hypothetical protein VM846_14780 [Vicinamibacterales bacterium]|nr:hypothetical protein [Vicinamibacterales bacterium]
MTSRRSTLFVCIFALTLIAVACGDDGPTSPDGASFQGTWQGTWQRTSCSETGSAVGNACNQTPDTGALRLTLSQSGSNVEGSVEFGQVIIPASGPVNNGTLRLAGSANLFGATWRLTNWSTTRSGNAMSGSFTMTIVPDNSGIGSQTVVISLQNVTRAS